MIDTNQLRDEQRDDDKLKFDNERMMAVILSFKAEKSRSYAGLDDSLYHFDYKRPVADFVRTRYVPRFEIYPVSSFTHPVFIADPNKVIPLNT